MQAPGQTLALALAAVCSVSGLWAGGGHGHAHDAAGGHGHAHDAAGGHGHGELDPHTAFARHHGVVLEKDGRLFEVSFSDQGVSVYPMTASGEALPTNGMHGTVLLKSRRGGRGRRIRLKLEPVVVEPGRLVAAGNLKSLKDGSRSAILTIKGLAGGGEANLWTRFKRNDPEASDHHGGNHAHDSHDGDSHGHPHPPQPAPSSQDDHGHSHGPGGHAH